MTASTPGPVRRAAWESPVGPIGLVLRGSALAAILLRTPARELPGAVEALYADAGRDAPRALADARHQLADYFSGKRRAFELELDWDQGTPFRRAVWRALLAIPYGTTVSYGELAASLGKPGASRAVGTANGANPIPIVVPCHRVVQHDGTLGGFSGGLDIKRALLNLEGSRPEIPDLFAGMNPGS